MISYPEIFQLTGLIFDFCGALLVGITSQMGFEPRKLPVDKTEHGIGRSLTAKKLGWKSSLWRITNIAGWSILCTGFLIQGLAIYFS